jgi:hypothetical protein
VCVVGRDTTHFFFFYKEDTYFLKEKIDSKSFGLKYHFSDENRAQGFRRKNCARGGTFHQVTLMQNSACARPWEAPVGAPSCEPARLHKESHAQGTCIDLILHAQLKSCHYFRQFSLRFFTFIPPLYIGHYSPQDDKATGWIVPSHGSRADDMVPSFNERTQQKANELITTVCQQNRMPISFY